MDWGVAFVTARAGVYAMMMGGSLPDDQGRHGPDYTDEANVQSALKHIFSNIMIMSNLPALLLGDQTPASFFGMRATCNPNPCH